MSRLPMKKLLYHSLKRKHNSSELTLGKMKVNQIVMRQKTEIANKYYEDIVLNKETEHLNKYYAKELAWFLFTKICWFQCKKVDEALIPVFKDIYWTNYIIAYYEVRFDFVHLYRFNEYDHLDVSLKTFFNEDRNEEIEREEYIQCKAVSNMSKRDKLETKASYKDILEFISRIDYAERVGEVKHKEGAKRASINMIQVEDNGDDFSVLRPFRRVATKRFGGLQMMKTKKAEELNAIVKEEEKIASLALNKPIKKTNPKFKGVEFFKKSQNVKNEMKKSIEVCIRKTLINIYQSKGFLVGEKSIESISTPKLSRRVMLPASSRNNRLIDTGANEAYSNLDNASFKRPMDKPLLPIVITSQMNYHRTSKPKAIISLKKYQSKQTLESTCSTDKHKNPYLNSSNRNSLRVKTIDHCLPKKKSLKRVLLLKGTLMK